MRASLRSTRVQGVLVALVALAVAAEVHVGTPQPTLFNPTAQLDTTQVVDLRVQEGR